MSVAHPNDVILYLHLTQERTLQIDHYDIVGDIHGHADPLRRLLHRLGYAERNGTFRHPERTMLLVGDFIDRGPEQREVLRLVRSMCDAGAARAVLGNHEFNAIGWATPDGAGGFHRERSVPNTIQHAKFIEAFGQGSADYEDAIRWDLAGLARSARRSIGACVLARGLACGIDAASRRARLLHRGRFA
jgi:hypothetical protein